MKLRKLVFNIHSIIGLFLGLIFAIAGLTGSAIVFRQETEERSRFNLMFIFRNAYKVPYLGFNGVFNLNAEHQSSIDPRDPKRIDAEKAVALKSNRFLSDKSN